METDDEVFLFKQVSNYLDDKNEQCIDYNEFENLIIKIALLTKDKIGKDGKICKGELNIKYDSNDDNEFIMENFIKYIGIEHNDTTINLDKKLSCKIPERNETSFKRHNRVSLQYSFKNAKQHDTSDNQIKTKNLMTQNKIIEDPLERDENQTMNFEGINKQNYTEKIDNNDIIEKFPVKEEYNTVIGDDNMMIESSNIILDNETRKEPPMGNEEEKVITNNDLPKESNLNMEETNNEVPQINTKLRRSFTKMDLITKEDFNKE